MTCRLLGWQQPWLVHVNMYPSLAIFPLALWLPTPLQVVFLSRLTLGTYMLVLNLISLVTFYLLFSPTSARAAFSANRPSMTSSSLQDKPKSGALRSLVLSHLFFNVGLWISKGFMGGHCVAA